MARLAYLGPECTFSHDLAKKQFRGDEHVPFGTLREVVESVATGNCRKGLVPFHNTTRLSIEESQRELVRHLGGVYVTDVVPFDVKHYLCGFGVTRGVTELRSKSVVYHQVSRWLAQHLPDATRNDAPSTSAAVVSVATDRHPHVAAIGTLSASRRYRVPVLEKQIQNKPNVTLFFLAEHHDAFRVDGKDHILLCCPRATEKDMQRIGDLAVIHGCRVSSNWSLRDDGKPPAYFAELSNPFSTLDLHAAVTSITGEMRKVRPCGGYAGRSITSLIWGTENASGR